MSIHWTIAQTCIWIRTRDQDQADNLEPRAARSLVLADTVVPGASLARHCLRAALDLGRFAAQGRTAQLDMVTASGELQNWILDDEAQSIPREFWEGADFLLGLEGDGAAKGKLGECGRFARVEFDRDRIVTHWPAPRSVLEDGPVPLSHLIECGALHAGTEDNWGWFFGRGDVTVTGLNAAGERKTIDSQRLAMAPLGIEGNTLTQGAVSWSFVVVSLTPPALPNVTQAPPPPPRVRGRMIVQREPPATVAISATDDLEPNSPPPEPPTPTLPCGDAAEVNEGEKTRRPHTAKASQKEHDRQFEKYRDECVAAGESPNVNADEPAARKLLGDRYDRERWRNSRRRLKPEGWSSTGKRKR